MKIYMIFTSGGSYCVFSETRMNNNNRSSEALALDEFYIGDTFDPADPKCVNYRLDDTSTKLLYDDDSTFGSVLYEIPSPNSTSTYEYW